ncbi:MAG: DUF1311 domain-containing protein [Ahrensia sp.]|nr:DUF1311 domain-containing protein [Ahrensia sp.]
MLFLGAALLLVALISGSIFGVRVHSRMRVPAFATGVLCVLGSVFLFVQPPDPGPNPEPNKLAASFDEALPHNPSAIPSFSCNEYYAGRERNVYSSLLCHDPVLAARDTQMRVVFDEHRESLRGDEWPFFLQSQREWRTKRRDNRCRSTISALKEASAKAAMILCMTDETNARIKEIEALEDGKTGVLGS